VLCVLLFAVSQTSGVVCGVQRQRKGWMSCLLPPLPPLHALGKATQAPDQIIWLC